MLYEAAPLAFIAEQAGGAASDGERRIMEIAPGALHERTPLFLGSKLDVEEAMQFIQGTASAEPAARAPRAPPRPAGAADAS